MKHQIYVRYSEKKDKNPALTIHLHHCISAALAAEGVEVPCEINVLVTNDEGIRMINNTTRNIDSATDVLSFPMFSFTAGEFPKDVSDLIDPQTGLLPPIRSHFLSPDRKAEGCKPLATGNPVQRPFRQDRSSSA